MTAAQAPTIQAPTIQAPTIQGRHLLGIEGLTVQNVRALLDLSEEVASVSPQIETERTVLRGRTLVNLFFESSPHTQSSFELAGKRLGADVTNVSVSTSGVKTSETLIDTATTLNAMRPDIVIIRHHAAGAVRLLAAKLDCAVVNAGDGAHEHPTQALLDALTIRRNKGRIEGLAVAICGDILHSGAARSNILLLALMGARVRVIAPSTLLPAGIENMGVEVFRDMKTGLRDADVVMFLGLRRERIHEGFVPSTREYLQFFGLDEAKLAMAKPDALVMHAGEENLGVEIGSMAGGAQSRIPEPVEAGIAVRMAVLRALAQHLPSA